MEVQVGVETEKFNFSLFEFHIFLFPLRYTSTEFIVYAYHTVIILVDINILESFIKLCNEIKYCRSNLAFRYFESTTGIGKSQIT